MAMLAVWMTSAVHMKGRKVRMVPMTSGLVVNSDGRKITMHAAAQQAPISSASKDHTSGLPHGCMGPSLSRQALWEGICENDSCRYVLDKAERLSPASTLLKMPMLKPVVISCFPKLCAASGLPTCRDSCPSYHASIVASSKGMAFLTCSTVCAMER